MADNQVDGVYQCHCTKRIGSVRCEGQSRAKIEFMLCASSFVVKGREQKLHRSLLLERDSLLVSDGNFMVKPYGNSINSLMAALSSYCKLTVFYFK